MSHVATPVSLTEWLLNYYKQAAQELPSEGYEVIVEPGEIMFVPCGWWHCVINLEASVAITQNYISRYNLVKVMKFLRGMPSSISGIDDLSIPQADITAAAVSMKSSGGRDVEMDEEEKMSLAKKIAFASGFEAAMLKRHPETMGDAVALLEEEANTRKAKEEAAKARQAIWLPVTAASAATIDETKSGADGDGTGFQFSF